MADEPIDRERFSLRRWSQRKRDAARERAPADGARRGDRRFAQPDPAAVRPVEAPGRETRAASLPAAAPDGAVPLVPAAVSEPAVPLAPAAITEAAARRAPAAAPNAAGLLPAAQTRGPEMVPPALPPLETLTIDSDYSMFMRPGVDDSVKCGALKKLFSDPRWNVMDGLDVYIDDYSKPDPIDPETVRTLVSARYIFNPPPTRVNALGHVEDVPDPPPEQASQDAPPTPEEQASQNAASTPEELQQGAPVQAPETLQYDAPPVDAAQDSSTTDVTDARGATSNRR